MAGISVLVVEAVATYRGAIAERLRDQGYDVAEAANAADALSALKATRFDVAIIDNLLPDLGGAELLASIGDLGLETRLVLIVEPSFPGARSPDIGAALGASRVLLGPIRPDAFPGHLAELLRGRAPAAPPPPAAGPSRDRPGASDAIRLLADEHMRNARRSYRERLPGELSRLAEALLTAREAADAEALRQTHHLAHTLHGTAGTLGFAEVSNAAARIEAAAKRLLSGSSDPALWAVLSDALDDARRSLEPREPT